MAKGSKKSYTGKQRRKASKIAKGHKKRGVSAKEAAARKGGNKAAAKRKK